MSASRTLSEHLFSLRQLCGIGEEGQRRDPSTPAELRQFCLKLRDWVIHRREELLNYGDGGRAVLAGGSDFTPEVQVAWHHLIRVAGASPFPPFEPGPYPPDKTAAALDRVVQWCDHHLVNSPQRVRATNPLHELIDRLYQFINTVTRAHQATTKEEHAAMIAAWPELTGPFWETYRLPTEALRGLSDRAIAWCSQKGLGGPENVYSIENAAKFVIDLAKHPPRTDPSVYSNPDVAQPAWERQEQLLLGADRALNDLRRLAAQTGAAWQWDRRLPWDPKMKQQEPCAANPSVSALRTALENLITRLLYDPGVLFEKAWDAPEGLDATTINKLAADLGRGPIFELEAPEGHLIVKVRHPDHGNATITWTVQNSDWEHFPAIQKDRDAARNRGPKFIDTIQCLRYWRDADGELPKVDVEIVEGRQPDSPVPSPEEEQPQQAEPQIVERVRITQQRTQALAAITLKLVEIIRQVFPVEGLPWLKAGEKEAGALRPFLDLLPDFAKCWWVPNDLGWQTIETCADDPPALKELVHSWQALFRHYEWGDMGVFITGKLDRRKTRWAWPDVPPLSKALLERLETAARSLSTSACPPASPPAPANEGELPDPPQGNGSPPLPTVEIQRPPLAPPPPNAIHNADFTMVLWHGTEYGFALGVQSSAVQALWEEWERSGLGLHQETIRNAIDAERDSFRMDTAFRNHPAFGTMIQRCGDGRYKLAPPGNQTTPSTPKTGRAAKRAPKSRRKRG
jgi:hypothetical protein